MPGNNSQGYSSGVTYYQLNSSTTSVPSVAAAGPFVDGFYGVDGTLEYLIWRLQTTNTGGTRNWTSDLSNLVSQFKLVCNGDILIDWVCGVTPDSDTTEVGRWGYFLNSIGGRSLQVPAADTTAAQEIYMAIPVGLALAGGTPRFEITTSFYDVDVIDSTATASTGTSTFWARFNPNTQRSTRVISATSFSHGANLTEQVVVRVPDMPAGYTCEVLSIQNASDTDDNYGTDGIRILSLSQFSMPISLQRWASNELGNGVMAVIPTASGNLQQTYRCSVGGILAVPLYGLAAGDITCMVANGAGADTRLYHPVLTAPMRGVNEASPRQTVASIGNTQKSIVARTEGSN